MKIEILRLNHRIARDKRISTHVALTARAFHASNLYYTGEKDREMEESVNKVTNRFGGKFKIEHLENEIKLIESKIKEGFEILHLTMYGVSFKNIKLKSDKLLIIVGGEKVEPHIYKMANYNISVTSQPISEVSALGILLYDLVGIKDEFINSKIKVIPSERGKFLKPN